MSPSDHGVMGRLSALDPARQDPELVVSADDLMLRRIMNSPREGADDQLVPKRRRGPMAAASIAALAVLGAGAVAWLVGDEPAYASWVPDPERTSVASSWQPAEQCPNTAHDIAGEGEDAEVVPIEVDPVLVDVRGDYTYQLSTNGLDAYVECFVTSDGDTYDVVANDAVGVAAQLPQPDEGVSVIQAGTTSWSEGIDSSPGALTAVFGRAAEEVSQVLLSTEDGQQVSASVENGWWAAWAPGDEVFVAEVTFIDDEGHRHTTGLEQARAAG